MAVAGLHNISAFSSSLFIESQSSVSRQRGEHDRPRTRASSILQMWRELEGEHVVSHSYSHTEDSQRAQRSDIETFDCPSTIVPDGQRIVNRSGGANEDHIQRCASLRQIELDNDSDDGRSVSSDQSSDLGEVERERVRQLIQEWMKTGVKSHSQSLDISHVNECSKAQWLGENERGRVRIIREWVQMNIHQSGTGSPREEVPTEIGQVRDGLLVDHSQNREKKAFCRLRGRQALVDLLMKSQTEREKELQGLSECKPVSDFAYRNRIQSLLRGRFLRSVRPTNDERTDTNAANELGFLRQRNTVSDLREEILSRLDDCVRGCTNNTPLSSAKDDPQPSQSNNEQEVIDELYDQSEFVNREKDANGSHVVANSESAIYEHVNQEHIINKIAGSSEQVGNDEHHEQDISNLEFIISLPERHNSSSTDFVESACDGRLQETAATEGTLQVVQEDHANFHDNDALQSEACDSHEISDDHFHDLERNIFEDYDWEGSSAHAEEVEEFIAEREESHLEEPEGFETDIEDNDSQGFYADHSEWADDATENMDGHWQDGAHNPANPGSVGSGMEEQSHAPEPRDEWHDEAIDDWFDMPSGQDDGSIGRIGSFYIPDDDNVYSIELRELLSRRRVSNLLRSSFRESLDQLIQSYVERQGHASFDWDMDGTSSYPSDTEQEPQQQENADREGHQMNMVESSFAMAPPQEAPSQPPWDQEPDVQNLPRQMSRHRMGGFEWDIIDELRIDMARLQQRMNEMQSMLQTCMEMQVELQRSVRQEVSAALNRCADSADVVSCGGSLLTDESKWDKVRTGICCLCCNNNIDSLLYRCGHMCICSICAERLIKEKAKCPMCGAPVIEVVRAFSIQ